MASALLLVTAVIAIVSFQTWYGSYSTGLFSKVESENSNEALNTIIETIVGDKLYFTNQFNENLSLNSVKINGATCNDVTTSNLTRGINSINFGNCTQNLTGGSYEVVVSTDQGVFSKKIYLKAGTTSSGSVSLEEEEESASLIVNNSLMFNDDDTQYLTQTPSSTGNRTTWTFSAWAKRTNGTGSIGGPTYSQMIFSNGGTVYGDQIFFSNNGSFKFAINGETSGVMESGVTFTNTSKWYHLVLSVDTRQATSSDRVKMWVDGEEVTTFSRLTYPSQNYQTDIGSDNNQQVIGTLRRGPSQTNTVDNNYLYDGYLSEFNFVDGLVLNYSNFAENNSGNWTPTIYNGSYGTNGFYLPFNLSSDLGKDYSGNGNDWSDSSFSSSNQVFDNPLRNYAVLNPLDISSSITLSDGNTKATSSTSNGWFGGRANLPIIQGQNYYWEAKVLTNTRIFFMIITDDADSSLGVFEDEFGNGGAARMDYTWRVTSSSDNIKYRATVVNSSSSVNVGDIVSASVDSSGVVRFYKNNNLVHEFSQTLNGSLTYYPALGLNGFSGAESMVFNFGQLTNLEGNSTTWDSDAQGSFIYTPPSGFKALKEFN